MSGEQLQSVVGVVVVVVGVALIAFMIANTFFKVGPQKLFGSLTLANSDPVPRVSTFLVGLTASVAAGTLIDTRQPVTTGAVLGLVFALVGIFARGSGDSMLSRFVRALIVLPISVLAFGPALEKFLAPACTEEPLAWFRPLIILVVMVAVAMGLLSLFFRTLAASLNPLRPILAVAEGLLAFYAAFKIAALFLSPFGLALVDLGAGGSAIAGAGLVVLIIACAIAPTWVLRIGGILILIANLAVFSTVQVACGAPDSTEFFVIVGYCAVYLLIGFVVGSLVKGKPASS